LSIFIDVDIAL